jgi:hypothetical protein
MTTLQFDDAVDPALPYGQLLDQLLARRGRVSAARVRSLSGGLSGACVLAVFAEGQSPPPPMLVKIASPDRIQDELRRYKKHIATKVRQVGETRIAQLVVPARSRLLKARGFDDREYQAIAYEYANPTGLREVRSFDELCGELADPARAGDGLSSAGAFDSLVATLDAVFYCQVARDERRVPLFALPQIPWDTFLPVAAAAAYAVPRWLEFVDSLPAKWHERARGGDPVAYRPIVCHGDLRCANVLVRQGERGWESFLIDFGQTGYGHPLADIPRLEADLLLRIALWHPEAPEVFRLVLAEQRINPGEWERHKLPFVRLLSRMRAASAQIATRWRLDDAVASRMYRMFLLGNAARFARRYDRSVPSDPRRLDYVWFVLSLASRLLGGRDLDPPPSREPQQAEDMARCGVVDFFWGPERRNRRKLELLRNHAGPVRLLAHTGHSYLDPGGGADARGRPAGPFYSALCERIGRPSGDRVEIVVLNPYSVEGSKLGIAEARGDLRGPELDLEYFERHTELFRRFDVCLDSYQQLRRQLGGGTNPNLELRITDFSPDATILLSRQEAFFEPYVVGRLAHRYHTDQRMNAPELLTRSGTPLFEVAESQFEFFWKRSISVEEYLGRRDEFRAEFMRSERLRRKSEALHESWFAVDPIVGCPNSCAYCFLRPFKVNGRPAPYMFRTAKEAYVRLRAYEWFNKQTELVKGALKGDERLPVPIACGNYTEMLDDCHPYPTAAGFTSNRRQLELIIEEHARMGLSLRDSGVTPPPLCIVSKQAFPADLEGFVRGMLRKYPHLRLALFVSLSFLPPECESGSASVDERLRNFELMETLNRDVGGGDGASRRAAGIHFWRPLVPKLHTRDDRVEQLRRVREHGALSSVAVGLKLSKRLKTELNGATWTSEGGLRRLDFPDLQEGEWFDEGVRQDALAAGFQVQHPVFVHTSCAVSHAFGRPDYNATFEQALPPPRSTVDQLLGACLVPSARTRLESDGEGHHWLALDRDLEVDQELQTFLQQMLGIEVSATIRKTHEWSGSASAPRHGKPCRESTCPDTQRKICREFYRRRAASTHPSC